MKIIGFLMSPIGLMLLFLTLLIFIFLDDWRLGFTTVMFALNCFALVWFLAERK